MARKSLTSLLDSSRQHGKFGGKGWAGWASADEIFAVYGLETRPTFVPNLKLYFEEKSL